MSSICNPVFTTTDFQLVWVITHILSSFHSHQSAQITTLTHKTMHDALVDLVVEDKRAFTLTESPAFRRYSMLLNPASLEFLVGSTALKDTIQDCIAQR